ncbi:MAG: aminomethyl-transferring glycine dehydrogenase subunit GcvPA [Halobacteriales archaeon]
MPVTPTSGSPFAPHTEAETEAMLEAVGLDDVEELFDIPEGIAFDGRFDIPQRAEREIVREVREHLGASEELTCLLGRGHYDHYVPAIVDEVAGRSEFLTSYTQYQPEASQGYLQALFEYQSMLVELTGLGVANCSLYDAATALGEAATFADRIRATDGDTVLVPDTVAPARRSTLENYAAGPGLEVATYPTAEGTADLDGLAEAVDADTIMVYAESPSIVGAIEPDLAAIGEVAADHDAAFALGSDPIALSLLERPADVGVDVVVGDAGVLGLPAAFGMGLGLFATREEYVRQVPGRLVGATEDADGTRAFALTLVTREQHIRRERATSNICTNQAWVALRAAIHAAWLGADGLLDLAQEAVRRPRDVAARLDAIDGVTAPRYDRHHFREFAFTVDDAPSVADALLDRGYAVHTLGEETLQACVVNREETVLDGFVAAVEEVVA